MDPLTTSATKPLDWHQELATAVRDVEDLFSRLALPDELLPEAKIAAEQFPLMVPQSYLTRMEVGNRTDPLLLQVLPLGKELRSPSGFSIDAVGDEQARSAPGMLHKYHGRALLIATGSCAVHCRYCFRRSYPYGEEPRTMEAWKPALDSIRADKSLTEIILSGGDPLMLTDHRLHELIAALADIPHLQRLRIHTRLPIVLPSRVSPELLALLTESRLTPIVVVHANHPQEIVTDCAEAIRKLVRGGITTLNQAVLLRGINDTSETQFALCERLIDLGAIPYYLHQLDRVSGTAHFEVPEATGQEIITALTSRLPGYAVPRYVREIPGAESKTSLS